MMTRNIPVVDVFAGCGGLGEGFSSSPFELRLSIEKGEAPHATLWLRSFFHQFGKGEVPSHYYDYVAGRIPRDELCLHHPLEALEASLRCLRMELGGEEQGNSRVNAAIERAIDHNREWILIGGPPCQAYSTIGRVKKQSLDHYDPNTDICFELYREYLKIIGAHWPSVFVFENVKGLLRSSHRDESIFNRMVTDLCDPRKLSHQTAFVCHVITRIRCIPFSQSDRLSMTKIGNIIQMTLLSRQSITEFLKRVIDSL